MISDYKKIISTDLYKYLENEVLPQYKKNDSGHSFEHIDYVLRRAMNFSKEFDEINYEMVFTIAIYHDIAHHINKSTHEKLSAEMFYKDDFWRGFFTEKERIIIKEAIEDHRASADSPPRSVYGKIISSADRSTDLCEFLKRTHAYTLKHYPNISEEEIIERAYEHASDKYGKNGYAKHYLKDMEYEKFIDDINRLLQDKNEFGKFYNNCIRKEK